MRHQADWDRFVSHSLYSPCSVYVVYPVRLRLGVYVGLTWTIMQLSHAFQVLDVTGIASHTKCMDADSLPLSPAMHIGWLAHRT